MRLLDVIREAWQNLDRPQRLWCGYALIVLLAAAVAWTALDAKVRSLEKKRAAREAVLKELMPLKVAYLLARLSTDQMSRRMATLRPDDSPAKIIDEIAIKGKSVKISPLKGDERNGMLEDAADIRIDALTFNEAVNLLYRLEKGGRPIVIKKCSIKVRFDDSSRCDLMLSLALLKPAPVLSK
ncbi:MAG TPA: general secretion pathway protein GspM [Desulfuromonadales bacterium]|nr:general secretion pathway protein GspM [Desulfuromonadales bacterium]